jgi:hypothetical protein
LKTRLALWLVPALALAPSAFAACEVGFGAGSTLLFPYFEVDTADPAGLTTLLSINNESSTATLTRLVVWTDWAIPLLGFDIYLKPRDVQTINVRDLLNGILPSTGSGSDLSSFPDCGLTPPTHANPALAPLQISQLRADLTGVLGPGNPQCAGEAYGDGHARGYITVDTVGVCNGIILSATQTPATATYYTATAIVKNVLWGDFFYVNPAENSAQGTEAINIVGDAAGFAGLDVNTFYGRYHSFDGRDKRSPLPTTWTSRFLNGGAFTGGTDLIVFRDTHVATIARRPCGGHPFWYPLVANFVTARDEDTNLALSLTNTGEFPLATQRVPVASLGTGPTAAFGRIQLGLFFSRANAGAWVLPVMTASGKFSLDFNAQPLATGCGLDPTP